MFKREMERASTASSSLNLKPPYSNKVASKQFLLKYKVPNSKVYTHKGNTKKHVTHFLDSMVPFLKYTELGL